MLLASEKEPTYRTPCGQRSRFLAIALKFLSRLRFIADGGDGGCEERGHRTRRQGNRGSGDGSGDFGMGFRNGYVSGRTKKGQRPFMVKAGRNVC